MSRCNLCMYETTQFSGGSGRERRNPAESEGLRSAGGRRPANPSGSLEVHFRDTGKDHAGVDAPLSSSGRGLSGAAGRPACPVSVSGSGSRRGYVVRIPLAANEVVYGLGLQLQSHHPARIEEEAAGQCGSRRSIRGDSHAPVAVLCDDVRLRRAHRHGAVRDVLLRRETAQAPEDAAPLAVGTDALRRRTAAIGSTRRRR